MQHIPVVLILLILWVHAVASQSSQLKWEELDQGEVIVEEVETASGIPGVRATFLVKASREDIWTTLLDYNNFPNLFEGIDRMQVLEEDQHGARIEFWVDAVLTDLHYILYRNYVEPGYRLTWRRVSGDLKQIQGSWDILDTDNAERKILVYESYVDIGFSIVTWIIRQGAKDRAEKMGHRLRDWLERDQ